MNNSEHPLEESGISYRGGNPPTVIQPLGLQEKINRLIKLVSELVYYSQIHTVKGVQPVEMQSHDESWREAQKWLWDNCKSSEGEYFLFYSTPPPLNLLKETVNNQHSLILSAEQRGYEKAKQEFTQPLGIDTPWPLSDVLRRLIDAAEILLNKKDYDGPDWEEIGHSVKAAKEYLQTFTSSPPPSLGIDVEELAKELYPERFEQCNGTLGMYGLCDVNYYNREAFKAGYAASKSSANDFDLLKRKLDFYREQTDKVRELIFSRNDIGEPCQPLYDAIVDKITLQEKEIDRLKIQSSTSEEEKEEIIWREFFSNANNEDDIDKLLITYKISKR